MSKKTGINLKVNLKNTEQLIKTLYAPIEGRKDMFYLTMHSAHFYGYMASDIW